MPQTDILNPKPLHPLNPDYAFVRKRPLTHLQAKANQGAPYQRDVTDILHQFELSWNDRLANDARRLKWYYEQYRKGFFTYIDHESGGRHYVGRFTTPVEPSAISHNHWAIQQITFEEIPGVPMLVYPHDWDRDSIWEYALNDFGDRMVAAVSGTWTLVADANAKSGYHFENAGVFTLDCAGYNYVGYGFQVWAPTGPALGQASVMLDDVVVGTIDLYSGSTQKSQMLFQKLDVPAGLHRVKLFPQNAKNASSSGYTVLWDALRVMI